MYTTARNLFATSMLILFSAAAVAAPAPSIKNLEDKSNVTLSGTVDKISDDHAFTLSNTTGKIKVEVPKDTSLAVKQGDNVTVTGVVNNGLFRKKIEASRVMIAADASTNQ